MWNNLIFLFVGLRRWYGSFGEGSGGCFFRSFWKYICVIYYGVFFFFGEKFVWDGVVVFELDLRVRIRG